MKHITLIYRATLLSALCLFLMPQTIDARRVRKKSASKIVSEAMSSGTATSTDSAMPSYEPEAPIKKDALPTPKTEDLVSVNYDNSDLVDFINALAALKEINIVLPLGANAIKEKLTLSIERQLSLDEAWQLLNLVLSMADYKIVQHENMYEVLKNGKETAKSAVKHLYVNTNEESIPDTDELIRYVYHLEHMRLPNDGKSELEGLLRDMLQADQTLFKMDPASNSVILAASGRTIRGVVNIIKALDVAGFEETASFIRLYHSSASTVAGVLNELRQSTGQDDIGYRTESRKKSDSGYFSKNVRVVPYEPLNSLLVVGRQKDVKLIKEFVANNIDVPLGSGKSVIHTYELQYLKAGDFAKVLEQVVQSSKSGGTEQSKAGKGGPDQAFEEVIIRADHPATSSEKGHTFSSNKLIVVARDKDWKHIESLIKDLDKPQPQVLLEVLIADLTIDDIRLLGGMTRTPARFPLPNMMNFQSAQLSPGVIVDAPAGQAQTIGIIEKPTRAVADLLGASPAHVHKTSPGVVRAQDAGGAGTSISLNDDDGTTWSILHLLKVFSHTKILSHPHLVTLDNEEAVFELGEYRLVKGEVLTADNTNNFRKQAPIEANTTVRITPRIGRSMLPGQDPVLESMVNLTVKIDINEFKGETSETQIKRRVETSTNVQDNAILALGGLAKTKSDESSRKTPILGDIPVLGWFFKQRSSTADKTCLTVFIRPTIIDPYKRERMNRATEDYITATRDHSDASLFDNLRDPITRWFFPKEDAGKAIDNFMSKDRPTYKPKNGTVAQTKPECAAPTQEPVKATTDWDTIKKQLRYEQNPLAKNLDVKKRHQAT